jgi:zeaxanthin glucosyltransferase
MVPIHLRLPYVLIWSVLHFDFSGATPLSLYGWPHETSPEAMARNVAGLEIIGELREAMLPIAQAYGDRNGLEIDWTNPTATSCELAAITQTPKEFDFLFLRCLRIFITRVPCTTTTDGRRFPLAGRN